MLAAPLHLRRGNRPDKAPLPDGRFLDFQNHWSVDPDFDVDVDLRGHDLFAALGLDDPQRDEA